MTRTSAATIEDEWAARMGGASELLATPEVAFALSVTGLVAAALWLAHPQQAALRVAGLGVGALGVAGLALRPVSLLAGFLLLLAGLSFMMEVVNLPGVALHAVGGALALVAAGLSLDDPWNGAHPGLVIPVAAAAGGGVFHAARTSSRAVQNKPFAAGPGLAGSEAVVLLADGKCGFAVVRGELWRLHATGGDALREGDTVQVVAHETGELLVRRASR